MGIITQHESKVCEWCKSVRKAYADFDIEKEFDRQFIEKQKVRDTIDKLTSQGLVHANYLKRELGLDR